MRVELPNWQITPPDLARDFYEPTPAFTCQLPQLPDVASATARAHQRLAQVNTLEEVLLEEMEHVETLDCFPWILEAALGKVWAQTELLLGDKAAQTRFAAIDANYTALKMELMEPHLGGKAPVKRPEIFAAFHGLPFALRNVITRLDRHYPTDANHLRVIFGLDLTSTKWPQIVALWPALADALLIQNWAIEGNASKRDRMDGPFLLLGRQSALLPQAQRFL